MSFWWRRSVPGQRRQMRRCKVKSTQVHAMGALRAFKRQRAPVRKLRSQRIAYEESF